MENRKGIPLAAATLLAAFLSASAAFADGAINPGTIQGLRDSVAQVRITGTAPPPSAGGSAANGGQTQVAVVPRSSSDPATILNGLVASGTGGRHNISILELSAGWCEPCKRNTGYLDSLLVRCGSQVNSAELLAQADPATANFTPWLNRRHPVLIPYDPGHNNSDMSDAILERLGIGGDVGLPLTVVLVDGKVVFRQGGFFEQSGTNLNGTPQPVDIGVSRLTSLVRANGVPGFSCGSTGSGGH